MSKLLYKLEQKFGKYAIPNLPLFLIICYAFGFLMSLIRPQWIDVVTLNPYAILHGQVWRLVSWVLVPEETNILIVLLVMYFYYSIGRTLEKTWGSFLFNVYVFSGMFFTVVGAFLLYAFFSIFGAGWIEFQEGAMLASYGAECPAWMGGSYIYAIIAQFFGTFYINMSIFLAFAIMYPDMKVFLFGLLPIKVKFLGIFYCLILGIEIVTGFFRGGFYFGMMELVSIGMSLLNTVIFFIATKKGKYKSPKEIKRQHEYKVKIKKATPVSRHKCAICGRTDESNPELTFRYCSKCTGSYEYCEDHLFTHRHIG